MGEIKTDLSKEVLNLFASNPSRRYKVKEISRILDLDWEKGSEDRSALGTLLNQLHKDGKILSSPQGFYRPSKDHSNIRMLGDARPQKFGKDVTYETFVGVVDVDSSGNPVVRPAEDERNPVALEPHNLVNGTIVTVQVRSDFNAAAKIIHDHGHLEQEAGLSKLSALSLGIPIEFPEDILEGVDLSIPRISKYRKDYRHIPFLTIDPETAKDFDDAICVRKKGRNWQVMVAVADVAHYVKPGTKIFEEAYRRGNSTYLNDIVFPMLPEELSNGVCSLKPNEDRAAIITEMTISPTGEILDYNIERGLIRSRARLNYDQVQEAIEGRANKGIQSLYNRYISKAYGAYQALLTDRVRRGALDLNAMEQRVEFKKNGKLSIKMEEGNESHGIIEELMIAANRSAIEFLLDKGEKVIARVHGKPNERTYAKIIGQLRRLNVHLPSDSLNIEAKIEHILRQAQNHPEGDSIRTLMTRVQDRAYYSTEVSEHFGLQLKKYTHKTSPIRRMTDLYIDYLLGAHIRGGVTLPKELQKKMARAANVFSETERRSQQAEEETSRRVVAKWIKGHLGEDFEATVTRISKGIIHIKIDDPEITAKIHVKSAFNFATGDKIDVTPTHSDQITGVIQFQRVYQPKENATGDTLAALPFMQPARKAERVNVPS